MLLVFLLGFTWAWWYAQSTLSWQLPKEWEGQPLIATGYVATMPEGGSDETTFIFKLISLQYEQQHISKPTLIRLTWRNPSHAIHAGDHCELPVKLKRIHGTQNPGGFDMEAWALQKGLRATGNIINPKSHQSIQPIKIKIQKSWHYPIEQAREYLSLHIKQQLPVSKTSGWLLALTVGERSNMPVDQWQVLRNTGTNHLMAIAGLHIGFLSGMMYALILFLWSRIRRLALMIPAPHAAACTALVVAVLYSLCAGFSLPTQRACFMLIIVTITILLNRKINPWQVWALALFTELLINPLSVLTDSFWLSFATIALIIFGMRGEFLSHSLWEKYGKVQWVIGIGLLPLSMFLFQECSFISFGANSIAIPWLEFLILPFCFLTDIFILPTPSIAHALLWIADKSLSGLWFVLTLFSHWHLATWHHAMPSFGVMFASTVAILLLLLPRHFPGKLLSVVWILPLLTFNVPVPKMGDYWFTMLDVGQGLSVVVQTHSHLLVYDTGPKFGAMDMGENVVLPYLYTLDKKHIDTLIISHGDNDHIGGAAAILTTLPVDHILTSTPEKFSTIKTKIMPRYCLAGEAWQWDGVSFQMLGPTLDNLELDNNSSCVLRIDNGKQVTLLTGDIEKSAELDLLARVPTLLAANILVAPHHGSKTSGLAAFIHAVHPNYVFYATGYRNRYHFPNPKVTQSYADLGAKSGDTSEMGEISLINQQDASVQKITFFRGFHSRYWYTGK